jgi:6-phosphogluconolactonase/glucosamine-6-phosphate isomerase/deaminase
MRKEFGGHAESSRCNAVALQIEICPDADAVARRGAEHVARKAGAAIADHGRFTFAVSGGQTP